MKFVLSSAARRFLEGLLLLEGLKRPLPVIRAVGSGAADEWNPLTSSLVSLKREGAVLMTMSLSPHDLRNYLLLLLERYLPNLQGRDSLPIDIVERSLIRVEFCFSRIRLKYYQEDGKATFSHLHGDQMAALLWILGHECMLSGQDGVAVRLAYLNRIMHGIDAFPWVVPPQVFLLVHPLGVVLGRASYSDYLVVYHSVTVGSSDDAYPTLGASNVLYSGTSILGPATTGDNVVFGANTLLIGKPVPSNSLVVGQFPTNRIVPRDGDVRRDFFFA